MTKLFCALLLMAYLFTINGLKEHEWNMGLKKRDNLQKFDSAAKEFASGGKTLFTYLTEGFENVYSLSESPQNVSFQCFNDTAKILVDLENKEDYAEKFFDAEAKIPPGILEGQTAWTGDYQECLSIKSYRTKNAHNSHQFAGKYFTVSYKKRLFLGICMPNSCDKNNVQELLGTVVPTADISGVYTTDRNKIDTSTIMAFVVLSIILAIVIIGTAVDYFETMYNKHLQESKINGYTQIDEQLSENTGLLADKKGYDKSTFRGTLLKVLQSFSIFNNTRKLMSTETANGPLACLNGLRVISMWWVIQGHTYGFTTLVLKNPLFVYSTVIPRFSFQAILNGTYSVDTFFFLSGLLVCYLALKELSERGRINWFYYILHRYWRLTPVYAICLMFFTTIYRLLVSGPFHWVALDPDGPLYHAVEQCRNYWWSNLLYINNLYPNYGQDGCFAWAWYLANDMQFYIALSPWVIILLHRYRKRGIAFCLFLIVSSIASKCIVADYYEMNQQGQVTKHTDEKWAKSDPLYTKPYARWSVYIVGMLTGYFLHYTKCQMRMNKLVTWLGWALSIAMGMSVIYGLYYYNSHPGTVMGKTGTLFYLSCARTTWAVALAWLVIACATGHGGWINNILKWKFWAPMGRLTYTAYLIHPMILFGYYLNLLSPLEYTDITMVYMFIGNLILSYAGAYIVSMAFEAPMMNLEKLILGKSK
ncbi:nose resistant to fluoxetine protein 6-like [Dreissena polymorpha]|uniref:nose resistant to fluoxetine protein 6-like n=1 Tax=Dreissena polymorpha TaxID=45954 RepID=UPI002263DCC3|nr:nose resistant to fluoxetine protein 6-like [Dreissena polymorpha]